MTDTFEQDLATAFAEPPEAPDADAFHQATMARLDHRLKLRRWTLTAAGLGGAAVAASPILAFAPSALDEGHRAGVRMEDLTGHLAALAASQLGGVQGWMIWAGVGLAVVAVHRIAAQMRDA